jgi:hypothetical protein
MVVGSEVERRLFLDAGSRRLPGGPRQERDDRGREHEQGAELLPAWSSELGGLWRGRRGSPGRGRRRAACGVPKLRSHVRIELICRQNQISVPHT